MNRRILGALALAVVTAVAPGSVFAQQPSESPAPGSPSASAGPGESPAAGRPGPAADKLLWKSFFVDRAPLDLQAGNMDLYMYGLRTEAAQKLQGAAGIKLINAPATSLSLILNPAPAPEGQLNPFSIQEVRQAMQYLVDRDFIANDIYGGLEQPQVTAIGSSDPDFLTIYDIDRGSDIHYDPDQAHEMITDAMTKAGAQLVNDVWTFNGQPIQLKFIARVEDERRQIGDLVRGELEKAGFQVSMLYQDFAPAIQSVYSSDPQAFQWNLYTEGWSKGAAQRYDDATINAMNAPWVGNMPGWLESGFWQYQDPQMDQLGQKLFRGQFGSQDERNDIFRQMAQMGLDASVRIWLGTVINSFPATSDLQDATVDVVAGPRSPWTLRSANIPGKTDLTVGHLWVWTERSTWNPIGGFGDVYSSDEWRQLYDPPIANNPFTGIPQPFRANYDVQTAGPTGKLDVPSDAVTWDAANDKWTPVAAGTQAVSKVTFDYSKYFSSKWHDGQPITLADAVYSIAQAFDISYDQDKAQTEVAIAATSRPYLDTFKGFRFTDDGKVEVYVDYWHFDPNHIAAYASPTSLSMPWEILAAMDDVVFDQHRGAYSDTAAARFNVPWLSLVQHSDATLVNRTMKQMELQKTVPAGVFDVGGKSLVSADDAVARYQAAEDWFQTYGHLVISDGPFFLAKYDAAAQFAEMDAFRDPTYPFTAADFNLGAPPTLTITDVNAPDITVGAPAEIDATVQGPGTVGLRYVIVDPSNGQVIEKGEATPTGTPGGFAVTLGADVTTNLFPGSLYKLSLAAYSDSVALVSEREVDLQAGL